MRLKSFMYISKLDMDKHNKVREDGSLHWLASLFRMQNLGGTTPR